MTEPDSSAFVELRADCSRCAALCCVVPGFTASSEFAIDKPARVPCPNLGEDFGCTVHERLPEAGFTGCAGYDCFGAGQHVVQVTFGGRDWRTEPALANSMFDSFPIVRELNELRWHLMSAQLLDTDATIGRALDDELNSLADKTNGSPDVLRGLDLVATRTAARRLLATVSEQVRVAAGGLGQDLSGRNLVAADLREMDLRCANLRGALLIGADLRGTDLSMVDLAGADLRGARVHAARLDSTLFLTQAQLDTTRGDDTTVLAGSLHRPSGWPRTA
jgi:uncharacterized protein YjbI with pentapeptide repeats